MNGPRPSSPKAGRKGWRAQALRFLVGAIFGAGSAYVVLSTGMLDQWSVDELLSFILSLVLILSGIAICIASTSPARYRQLTSETGIDPPEQAELSSLRVQGYVIILAGILYVLPPLLAHADLPFDIRIAAAAGVLVLLAFQTWLNVRVWQAADELTRSVTAAACAACFWGLQLVLFVWAMLVKLELVPEIGSWTVVTLLLASYLIASGVIGVRRGLAQM